MRLAAAFFDRLAHGIFVLARFFLLAPLTLLFFPGQPFLPRDAALFIVAALRLGVKCRLQVGFKTGAFAF